jgi:hypothetical protein
MLPFVLRELHSCQTRSGARGPARPSSSNLHQLLASEALLEVLPHAGPLAANEDDTGMPTGVVRLRVQELATAVVAAAEGRKGE